MSALSPARIFYTFHSNTTAVPAEITTQILKYIIADTQPLPLGAGVTIHSTHRPIGIGITGSSFDLPPPPLSTSTNGRASAPVELKIGEVELKGSAFFPEERLAVVH
ncbi:hypothetical protein DL98DRAFT_596344 [Cadophora sp. DSE1049]|nr:hypothetical protein DL98DRAFT_596344 [Cadophora sp. DSE1049]